MLGNRPAQESELVGPICARFGLTVEGSRLLISEGRKVGFVVDCGSLPLSSRCFVEEFPTPSTSMERNSSRGKALCLLPKGFKVVGLVEGSVYLGEVVYDEAWKRSYKFHLVEGADIVKSSMPCSNPTSAFKEIEAVIKVQTNKKRHRKPDARSNGKLYMAVMYSATQRLLRERFRDCASKVPEDVRPIFLEWLENRSSNKSFSVGTHDHVAVVPHSLAQAKPSLPRHSSAPITGPINTSRTLLDGDRPIYRNVSGSFDPQMSSDNGTSDASIYDRHPGGTAIATSRSRSSGSLDEYNLMYATSFGTDGFGSSRKRSSGSVDESAPVLITRKRASGSIDEDSLVFRELENMHHAPAHHHHAPHSTSTSTVLTDAGELFADCFRLTGDELSSPHFLDGTASGMHTPSTSENSLLLAFPDSGRDTTPAASTSMTSSELYQTLREPNRDLSPAQLAGAISMIVQIPATHVPLKHIEDIVRSLTRNGKRSTLENFIDELEARESSVQEFFISLDPERTGSVEISALRLARVQNRPKFDEILDMDDLQSKMDSLSVVGDTRMNSQSSRKVTFEHFKAMVLPLPSSASIRSVLDLVKAGLSDAIDMDIFNF